MAIRFDGDGSIFGMSEGGLPDASVTIDDLATTLDLSSKTLTLPSGIGSKILQVKNAVKQGDQSFTASSWTTITDTQVSITPTSATSTFLVMGSYVLGAGGAWRSMGRISRNESSFVGGYQGDAAGSKDRTQMGGVPYTVYNGSQRPCKMYLIDSPATTSTLTYEMQIYCNDGGTIYVNKSGQEADNGNHTRSCSFLTVFEISG